MVRDLNYKTDPVGIWELFVGEENKNIEVNPEYTYALWSDILEKGAGKGFLLCDDTTGEIQGWLTCMKCPSIWSGKVRAVETSFFIRPQYRGGLGFVSLIKAFHDWAKKEGCAKTVLTHIVNSQSDKIAELYKKMGYTLFECDYERNL